MVHRAMGAICQSCTYYIDHIFFTHLNDRGKMHVAYNGPFYLFPVYSSVASSAFVLCVPSPPVFRAVSSFQTEALNGVKISFLAPPSHC